MEMWVVFYMCLNFLISVSLAGCGALKEYALSPNWFYSNSKMNKLGCWATSLLISCIATFYYVILFFYWVSHIGRKQA